MHALKNNNKIPQNKKIYGRADDDKLISIAVEEDKKEERGIITDTI